MKKFLIFILEVAFFCFIINNISNAAVPIQKIGKGLQKQADTLDPKVVRKTLSAIQCARYSGLEHNNILTIVDFSKPSSEKRLWIYDLEKNKLLFHTYVAHGIKSGLLLPTFFSNKINSHASSIGIYHTNATYIGHHGLSLKLRGLDDEFNQNAYSRNIVVHGAWYVSEDFLKKYGRLGRSWGCPAVPNEIIEPIINVLKDGSLLIVYYPNTKWFVESKYLNCKPVRSRFATIKHKVRKGKNLIKKIKEILFADKNKNDQLDGDEPLVVISADSYQRIFKTKAPLKRMLRSQVDNVEYIALNHADFENMDTNKDSAITASDDHGLNEIYFVKASGTIKGAMISTKAEKVSLGKLKGIMLNTNDPKERKNIKKHHAHFHDGDEVELKTTKQFIPWVGL